MSGNGKRVVDCEGDFTPVRDDEDAAGLSGLDTGGLSCKLTRTLSATRYSSRETDVYGERNRHTSANSPHQGLTLLSSSHTDSSTVLLPLSDHLSSPSLRYPSVAG